MASFSFSNIPIFNRVGGRDKAFLARQLATMVTSGLPLDRGITVLLTQTKKPVLKAALEGILKDLQSGAAFSTALAKHPEVFDEIFVSVVISGETVGKLGEVLDQLAIQLEKQNSFAGKVRGALLYPAFIVVAMLVVGAITMTRIVPQLESIFDEAHAKLPFATQALIWISNFLLNDWVIVLVVIAVAVVGGRYFFTSKVGRRLVDQLVIRLPYEQGLDLYMARFSRTLGMLMQAGTPIIKALDVTGEVINNSLYRDELILLRQQIERGIPLSVPLSESKLFPIIATQMVLVGEQTGKLDEVLLKMAEYYEDQSEEKIKNVSSLIEPVIIVIIGIAVGFMVYSILVPIYNIAQLQ